MMMMMSIGVMKMSENEFSATTGRNVISALIPAVSIPSLYLHLKKTFQLFQNAVTDQIVEGD